MTSVYLSMSAEAMVAEVERIRAVERAVHEGKVKEINGLADLVEHVHKAAEEKEIQVG